MNASKGLTLREPQSMTFHVAAETSHRNQRLSIIKFTIASAEVEFAKHRWWGNVTTSNFLRMTTLNTRLLFKNKYLAFGV